METIVENTDEYAKTTTLLAPVMTSKKQDDLKKMSTEELIESLGRVCTPIDVNRIQSLEEYLAERLEIEKQRTQAQAKPTKEQPKRPN